MTEITHVKDLTERNIKEILGILLLGGFFTMLNETALNIAFPSIMIEYAVSASTVQWLTTIFVFISGIVFLVSAYLMKKYSTRNLFAGALGFLVIGTIIGLVSNNFTLLFISRVIQAIGTGIFVPLVINSVMLLSPIEKRGFVMGLVSLVIFAAPMVSPVLMGAIMGITNWHAFFLLMLIFFIITGFVGYQHLKNISGRSSPELDVTSVILSIIGFGGILTAFSYIGELGFNILTISSFIIGIISLTLFCLRQFRIKQPLLDLRVFKNKIFAVGIIINTLSIMITFAIVILLPMYLQTALGTTSLIASLIMLPGSILNCFLPIVAGHIYDKKGPKIIVASGLIISCISMLLLSHLTITTSLTIIIILNCGFYVGSAITVSPNQTNTLSSLNQESYTSGSAIMTALQQMGGAVGSSLFVSFMSFGQVNYLKNIAHPTATQQIQGLVTGVNFSFTLAAIVLAVLFVFALTLKKQNHKKEESV